MTEQPADDPQPVRREGPRPGWPELAVSLAVFAGIAFLIPYLALPHLGLSPAAIGIMAGLLGGVAGIIGFAVAAGLRVRSPAAFGLRRCGARWLWLGAGGGIVALIAKLVIVPAFVALTGAATDTQDSYAAGATAGPVSVALTFVGLAILTPIGEELVFRGVLTTIALQRFRPLVAVLGSAAIFALGHGINFVLPAAFIVGVMAAELYRRSGSIWPGVVLHAVNNAISVGVYALLPALVAAGT